MIDLIGVLRKPSALRSHIRGKHVLGWAVPAVAALMLVAMLVPADVWHHPGNDAVYRGFDSNLVYATGTGYPMPQQGVVNIAPNTLTLIAPPNSQPVATLVTTPLKRFTAAMDVRILAGTDTGDALRLGVWSARAKSGYFLAFGSAPGYLITAEMVTDGVSAQTLVGGTGTGRQILGRYFVGLTYHVQMQLDKNSRAIVVHITSEQAIPTAGDALWLAGGPSDPQYSDVVSVPVPVEAGKEYDFGGLVKLVRGADAYKLTVQWLDEDGHVLGDATDWRNVQEVRGASQKDFKAVAPAGAASARLDLGAGNDTQVLFGNVYLRDTGTQLDLLTNGDFNLGVQGWVLPGGSTHPPALISPAPVNLSTTIDAAAMPQLFNSLRLALTASASSTSATAGSELSNYSLAVGHQRWEVVKLDDPRVKALTVVLLLAGSLLVLVRAAPSLRRTGLRLRRAIRSRDSAAMHRVRTLTFNPAYALIAIAALGVLLVLNAALFNLGSFPFDMLSAKVWTYVAAKHNITALYELPNTVGLAKVWGGAPYHEAVFPYDYLMVYYFAALGWMYRLFFAGPGAMQMDTFQLEALLKTFNVLFMIADAALIYLILRRLRLGQRASVAAACILLFNPAVWFSTSVWGQNHVLSVFLLLAAIWLTQRGALFLAWTALAAAALSRPQMLVPAALLGLFLLRQFPIHRNIHAIAWATIACFLLLAPFALEYGPSMPLDLVRNDLQVQEAGGNEPQLTTVSLDAYSAWPLVDPFASGASGVGRFDQRSSAPFVGGITYQRAGEVLAAAVVLLSGAMIFRRRRGYGGLDDCLLWLAVGTTGFLMFKTGLAPTHFIIGLPLIILCRKWLGRLTYYGFVAVWSLTTFVGMYGALGLNLTPGLLPALERSHSAVTRLVLHLFSADWFISIATFQNMVVFVGLAVAGLSGLVAWQWPEVARMRRWVGDW